VVGNITFFMIFAILICHSLHVAVDKRTNRCFVHLKNNKRLLVNIIGHFLHGSD